MPRKREKPYTEPRPKIPAAIDRAVRVEAGHACAINRCLNHTYLEIHHINGDRADNRFENLILLCLQHHRMADREEIDRPSVRQYKKLLSSPAIATTIAAAVAAAREQEAPLTIQILPASNPREGITRVEIVNLRDDKPLKIAAVRIIGLWEGGAEESIHDFPGLLWPEPDSIKNVEPDDNEVFIFPRSLGSVWFLDKKLKGFCAEVELRNKKKARSSTIHRPANPETEPMRQYLLQTEGAIELTAVSILNGHSSDVAFYDALLFRAQHGMGARRPAVPTISDSLIEDIQLTGSIHQWAEFSKLSVLLLQLNAAVGDYNDNSVDLNAAKTVLRLTKQQIPELIARIRKLIVDFFS